MDIETAPGLGWTFGPRWEANIIEFQSYGHLLCFSYKWSGEQRIHTYSLPDYKLFESDPTNDRELARDLHRILSECDACVAHNGRKFDLPYAASRFAYHRLGPPRPHAIIDTLQLARASFKFDCGNKLNDLGGYLNIGKKLPTRSDLWLRCVQGDRKAFKKMAEYNSRDVELLEAVWERLRPFQKRPPIIYPREEMDCPACQSSKTQRRGFTFARCSKKQRAQCTDCGHWFTAGGPIRELAGRATQEHTDRPV